MILSVSGVSKSFGTTPVLYDISLDVPQGSRTAIVGASGSGKSTLLRLIAGFERPDAGRILLGDRALAAQGRWVPAHRRGIGYVAQDGALFPHLTVAGNIAFGLPRGDSRTARVREAMHLAALDPVLAERFPHQLSGGQQQRVALARALAPRPGVILLDEPFSALDTGLRDQTRRAVITALERTGTTAVLVTHDREEALSFGNGIGVLVDGRLAQTGEPSTVFDAPASAEIAAFLGAAVLLPARVVKGAADCALGPVEIRHDLRNGTEGAVAMVRPVQVRIDADAPKSNAEVETVRHLGAVTELCLVVDGSDPQQIELTVPRHELRSLRAGSRVALRVDGGAVLYPADGRGRSILESNAPSGAPHAVGA
jgi:iron(III) transport system ATP-binding protein